jgi:hypothetical protein
LAEAVVAAVDGDTINILDDHTVTTSVLISGKDLTLAVPSATRTITFNEYSGITVSGATLTVNATSASRTVNFAGVADKYVDHSLIKVSGSSSVLTLKYSTISNGRALNNGGAIYQEGGTLKLTDTDFTGNSSRVGGAVYNRTGKLEMKNATNW